MSSEERWYFQKEGKTVGPISRSELVEKVRNGQLALTDLVYLEGDVRWKVVVEIEDIEKRSSHSSRLSGHVSLPNAETQQTWIVLVRSESGGETKFTQGGPFSESEIRAQLASKELSYGDYGWQTGYSDWVRIGAIDVFDRRKDVDVEGVAEADDDEVTELGVIPKVERNEWITPEAAPEEAVTVDLVEQSGVVPLKPPGPPKMPPALPAKPTPALRDRVSVPSSPRADEKKEPSAPASFVSPKEREAPVPTQKKNEMASVTDESSEEKPSLDSLVERMKRFKTESSLGVSAGNFAKQVKKDKSRYLIVALVVLAIGLVVVTRPDSAEDEEFVELDFPEAEFSAPATSSESPVSSNRKMVVPDPTDKVRPVVKNRPKVVKPALRERKPAKRRPASLDVAAPSQPADLGRATFIKIENANSKSLFIRSNVAKGQEVKVTFVGRKGQVLDSMGYYADLTFRQPYSGKIRVDYSKHKVPAGRYRLTASSGGLRAQQQNLLVGTKKNWSKSLVSSRKRWSHYRNREKQKLYYQLKSFDRVLDRLSKKKLSRSKALAELRRLKSKEILNSKSRVVRNLAFPMQWKQLARHIGQAESLFASKKKRAMASDSAIKLRVEVKAMKKQAGQLSVY